MTTPLANERIALLGRLVSMAKAHARKLVQDAGGTVVPRVDESVTLAVIGEDGPSPKQWMSEEPFTQADVQQAIARGDLTIIRESELWQRLGLVDDHAQQRRHYTPAMLAELVGVSTATIRRWQRCNLLTPVREVHRLAFFDFDELTAARRLAELAQCGCTLREIQHEVRRLQGYAKTHARPLVELPLVVQDKRLLIRSGDDLVEPGGQLQLPFDEAAADPQLRETASVSFDAAMAHDIPSPASPDSMVETAGELEDAGNLAGAISMYRSALAAAGPNAEINFLLADALYADGDLVASRERYYAAIECDENYAEARANLGCVLAELGDLELAAATFEGTLATCDDFPDVHLHLAKTLDALNRGDEAEAHWIAFLDLAPDSPWADEAARRLEC